MTGARVVVVGAGVVGLSTAVCVAEAFPSCSVTLLAEKSSPDTTSDGAAGILISVEFPDVPVERQRRWFQESFEHLLAIAQSQHAPEAGIMLSSGYQIFREIPAETEPFWADLVIGFRLMSERELKRFPGHKFGQAFTTVKCECSSYLPWLEKRFKKAGGQVQQKKVHNLEELSHGYDIIINCSGLGAGELVADAHVYPVRGQVLKVEAPWLHHFVRHADEPTYFYPGVHSVTVGGTRQEGDWRLQADPGDTRGILERCGQLEPSLRHAKVLQTWVGLRPGRRNPRVERAEARLRGRRVPVVHNYGHGGFGVTLAWGTALDACRLVGECLREMSPQAKL